MPANRPAHAGASAPLSALQSIRGIFALFIFFHHEGVFPAGGDAGVALFLMLSGFVMTYGYGDRVLARGFSPSSLFRRRVARVWPLHLCCLLLAVTLLPVALGPGTMAALGLNLVLLQSWVPLQEFYFSGNSVSWCLSDLMLLYLLFPWLWRRLHALSAARTLLLAAAIGAVYAAVLVLTPADLRVGAVYINPLMRLPDFLLGMGLCALFLHHESRLRSVSRTGATLAEACAWLLLALFIALYPAMPEAVQLACWWWMPCALLILVSASGSGLIGRLLCRRPLVRAGELSFSFYMVHQIVIRVLHRLLSHYRLDWDLWLQIAVGLCLAIAATCVIHRLVEEPARRWLLGIKPA